MQQLHLEVRSGYYEKFFEFLFCCGSVLIYSCGTLPNRTEEASFVFDRIGIIDTSAVKVSGKIFDIYEEFGLKEASIELTNSENTYARTCGVNGEFEFELIEPGKYLLIANFVGYFMFRDSVELKSGENIEMKIGLGYDE